MPNLPNNYGQVTLRWRYVPLTRDMSVTLGFFDSLSAGNAGAAAAFYRTQITTSGNPAFTNNMSTRWQFIGTTVLLRDNVGNLVSGVDTTVTTGTAAAPTNDQPVFAPLVVTKLTAQAGKRFRGRMYPPATTLDEAAVDGGGTISAGSVTGLQAIWNTFWTAINGSLYPPVLLHDPPGVVPFPTTITGFLVRPVVGVQRRRRTRGA